MADLITTDRPLDVRQRALLSALLDTLVPASDDGALPSAADVSFDAYLATQAADFVPALQSLLADFDESFPDLVMAERVDRVRDFSASEPEVFRALLTRVYDCYYQDDRVRRQIGVVTGAPFPQGNQVTPGDLALLDPVIANSTRHRYRKA